MFLKNKDLEAYCSLGGEIILLSSTIQPEYRSCVIGAGGVSFVIQLGACTVRQGTFYAIKAIKNPRGKSHVKPTNLGII
jgi:hypothetical protein